MLIKPVPASNIFRKRLGLRLSDQGIDRLWRNFSEKRQIFAALPGGPMGAVMRGKV